MKTILAATAVLALAACTPARTEPVTEPAPMPPAASTTTSSTSAIDPVGAYQFVAQVNGDAVNGTMEISGTPGAYTGRVASDHFPAFPIRSATAAGQELTIVSQTPNGDATFRLTFTGSEFTGTWSLGGDSGPVTGRRTR